MKTLLLTLFTGSASAGAVEAVDQIPTPDQLTEIGKLLIQLAIGIITLWKFLKEMKALKQGKRRVK